MAEIKEMVTDNSATKFAKTILTKKYGPLPFWAWLVIIAGTAFFVRKLLNSNTSNEVDIEAGVAPTDETTSVGATGDSLKVSGYTGAGIPVYNSVEPQQMANGKSNEEWRVEGVGYLVTKGINGYDADLALSKYIAGLPLATNEKVWVNDVIGAKGMPPQPITRNEYDTGTGTVIHGEVSTIKAKLIRYPTKTATAIIGIDWTTANGDPVTGTLMKQRKDSVDWTDQGPIQVAEGVGRDAFLATTQGTVRYRSLESDSRYKPVTSNQVSYTRK